jgi:hypothetical protein
VPWPSFSSSAHISTISNLNELKLWVWTYLAINYKSFVGLYLCHIENMDSTALKHMEEFSSRLKIITDQAGVSMKSDYATYFLKFWIVTYFQFLHWGFAQPWSHGKFCPAVVLEVLISCKLCSKLIVEACRRTPINKLVTSLLLCTNSLTIKLGTSLVHYIKTTIKLGRNLLLCIKPPTIQTRCFLLHWEENLLELHPVPMGGGRSQKQGQTLPCPRHLLLGIPPLQNFTPHYQHI